MKTPRPKIIELCVQQWEEILQHAASGPLSEAERQTLRAVGQSYVYLLELLESQGISLDRLRKLLFGSGSEKTRDVVPPPGGEGAAAPEVSPSSDEGSAPAAEGGPTVAEGPAEPRRSPPGHGRNGADEYTGAQKVQIAHGSLESGQRCPECGRGKVYRMAHPGVLVRIVGQAPVQGKIYELEKLRCNLCGQVFTADAPEGVGPERYDATAGSMIGLLKYGSGLPFHRLEGLQEALGIPLPASTQWGIVHGVAGTVKPAFDELVRQAAQGQVLHNDDTTVKILELMGKRARKEVLADFGESPEPADGHALADDGTDAPDASAGTSDASPRREDSERPEVKAERRGLFTSGIVSTNEGQSIALFFSGRKHAGENLADVLAQRASDLPAPIQMCDALSRNLPAKFKTLLGNCLAHGRRQFVEVAERFPQECRYVLESLAAVYQQDALAKEQGLSPEERLALHQAVSGPIMSQLHEWCTRQFEDRLVEPNSGLGQAISYLLRHWEKLTLFLRQAGAPLDNNIVERALKLAIRHRKNALFYKTLNGAHVGDIFMSLIYTCQLCGADPFDYLTELQRHSAELRPNPHQWMPWNYRQTLQGTASLDGTNP
jgi:transposase